MQVPEDGHASSEAVIHEKQMDIVRLLVSHGADLNAVDNNGLLYLFGWSPGPLKFLVLA